MAVPKRRTSRAKRNQRRANHDRMTTPNTSACPNCGTMALPHRVCGTCGHYRGRQVVAVAAEE